MFSWHAELIKHWDGFTLPLSEQEGWLTLCSLDTENIIVQQTKQKVVKSCNDSGTQHICLNHTSTVSLSLHLNCLCSVCNTLYYNCDVISFGNVCAF
jgi:hypothetical protein